MKRIAYLITEEKITNEYCKKIILKAAKFKDKRKNVKKVLCNLDLYAEKLKEIILKGGYKPSPYMVCNVVDQPSGKHRVLHKPVFFPDQCVHHVLIDLVYDRLIKRLDPYAIASIPGKGIHYGYRAITRWLNSDRKGTKYCLKCDICKCYDSIKPKYVIESFKKFVKDKKYLSLLSAVAFSLPQGLPLGNYTSGWFENVLLLELDTVIRNSNGVGYYLRYVDDFIVLSGNKRKLHKLVAVIVEVLAKIELTLKSNWQVFRVAVRGIDMLGYRFFYGYVLLRKRNLYGLYKTIKNFIKKPCRYWAVRVSCRLGSLKWCDSFNLQSMIAGKINILKMRALSSRRTV
jgi:hypothetical protein